MKFILLVGKFSKKAFGFQIIIKQYTLQIANWKFGIFNSNTYKWFPDDYFTKRVK
jgi:hypothetical protein